MILYSFAVITFILVLLRVCYKLILNRRYSARVVKLGAEPPLVPYYTPLGFDTMYRIVKVYTFLPTKRT
jgi:hypothetical protein